MSAPNLGCEITEKVDAPWYQRLVWPPNWVRGKLSNVTAECSVRASNVMVRGDRSGLWITFTSPDSPGINYTHYLHGSGLPIPSAAIPRDGDVLKFVSRYVLPGGFLPASEQYLDNITVIAKSGTGEN